MAVGALSTVVPAGPCVRGPAAGMRLQNGDAFASSPFPAHSLSVSTASNAVQMITLHAHVETCPADSMIAMQHTWGMSP